MECSANGNFECWCFCKIFKKKKKRLTTKKKPPENYSGRKQLTIFPVNAAMDEECLAVCSCLILPHRSFFFSLLGNQFLTGFRTNLKKQRLMPSILGNKRKNKICMEQLNFNWGRIPLLCLQRFVYGAIQPSMYLCAVPRPQGLRDDDDDDFFLSVVAGTFLKGLHVLLALSLWRFWIVLEVTFRP